MDNVICDCFTGMGVKKSDFPNVPKETLGAGFDRVDRGTGTANKKCL